MNSLVVAASSTSETYHLLVLLLDKHPQTIEILPGDGTIWMNTQNPIGTNAEPSFPPFLFIEGNLGIPQKVLYEVYLHAVHVFKTARSCVPTCSMVIDHPALQDASFVRSLTASSAILLLANPAYQTALNARKCLVQSRLIDPETELHFMASLLSSQHCAKYAELWYHRQWLLRFAYDRKVSDTDDGSVDTCRLRFASKDALQEELELVSRACELYPRNYFAWTHRVICLKSLLLDYLVGIDVVGFTSIFRDEIAVVKRWIDHHVSDYSAIHSILVLLQAAFQSRVSSLMDIIAKGNLLEHAISLVQDYPLHEALWTYIRMVLSISDSWKAQQTQHFIDCFVRPLAERQYLETGTEHDFNASKYAIKFLDRRADHYSP